MAPRRNPVLASSEVIRGVDCVVFCGEFVAMTKGRVMVNPHTGAREQLTGSVRESSGGGSGERGVYKVKLRASRSVTPRMRMREKYQVRGEVAQYGNGIAPTFMVTDVVESPRDVAGDLVETPPVIISAVGIIQSVRTYQSTREGGGIVCDITMNHRTPELFGHGILVRYLLEDTICEIPSREIFKKGWRAWFAGDLEGISSTTGELVVKVTDGRVQSQEA
ncbi:hypothetical protein PTTG_29278 [Puccinia triticina 1-1 BBBD Race 1]|uniref:Uncharacterized protein n=1 Tax=Puccinia triticina (isolate 1-1 / race 1 (BBBD)) TaxID=630390 RepID=A0A180G5U5_PUCT1|nr:hypothetical protein PTTG_29278 [Puccinia triticina 1-1 BBBD Race 1]